MAEIDTRPLDSVREAVTLFEPRIDQLNRFSPDRNEDEIVALTKELATCKLQFEVKENQAKQAIMKMEALQKDMQELSEKHDGRVAQVEAENILIKSQQSETSGECKALRDELAVVKGELDAAKASVALVLKEVETMETRAIMEKESTKEALIRILQLNETVLSSAVAAIRAEEERSVFFQQVTLEMFNSDRNLEVIRSQMETMEGMERELLAKTVEIEYLRSELNQAKEKYVSTREVSDAVDGVGGCNEMEGRQVQVCETSVRDQGPEAEFTFQHAPEDCFVSEIFSKDCQVVPSDDTALTIKMSDDVSECKEGAEAVVQDTTGLEGNSDAQDTGRLVDKIFVEDHRAVQQESKNTDAENDQEPAEAEGILPDSTACEVKLLQDHEEGKADASFVLDSSRDDFQSVRSDGKDISITMPAHVAGKQEQGAEAAAGTCVVVATENVSKDEDEFYTKELDAEQGAGKLDGYVLVAKSADADAAKDGKLLDAARAEISDLRFSLEEAVRRAELAEEAKAALERELREEIRNKHPSRRRPSDSEDPARRPALREGGTPPTPMRPPRPSPARTAGGTPTPRSARPGGEDLPTPRCGVTLGRVLNMKYK
ncbi:hypothetical protein EJB05_07580, partial [Eragrostis curvula]